MCSPSVRKRSGGRKELAGIDAADVPDPFLDLVHIYLPNDTYTHQTLPGEHLQCICQQIDLPDELWMREVSCANVIVAAPETTLAHFPHLARRSHELQQSDSR